MSQIQMVKWSSSWLEHTDENSEKVKIGLWAARKDHAFVTCVLCPSELNLIGFQCLSQHFKSKNHKELSTVKFGQNSKHLSGQQSSSQSKPVVAVDASIHDKIFASQALWLMKDAEDDLTLRDCDKTPALFQRMFPDSSVS